MTKRKKRQRPGQTYAARVLAGRNCKHIWFGAPMLADLAFLAAAWPEARWLKDVVARALRECAEREKAR